MNNIINEKGIKRNNIVIFNNQDINLEVNMKDETVWLNVEQMAVLFGRDAKTIRKHIKNALEEELEDSVVAKFATVQLEGNRKVRRNIEHYNLDMIISVGYRVKSKRGVEFRRWANQVLKDYLIKGYAANEKRLKALEKTVQLLEIANRNQDTVSGSDAKEILNVINDYSKALNLLDDYDHKRVSKVKGLLSEEVITYEECIQLIDMLRFNSESTLFGLERDKNFESIIKDIYQSFGGVDLYKTAEEKCANMLYLTVKNHAFIDGNKRIAATMFIFFLFRYNILYKNNKQVIDNNTLASMTLLIANSNPKEKELLIDLILNYMQ
jgi:prophage maintenance system killer protein/prophage antirepressor-like protein